MVIKDTYLERPYATAANRVSRSQALLLRFRNSTAESGQHMGRFEEGRLPSSLCLQAEAVFCHRSNFGNETG